ncbi:PapC/FimD family outer membrane usher protein [Aeromonas sp. CA23]|uniref:fimbria/pilus outer membrane usher protein n=1 Tax=Aeromonas sp. CA23 TaxID=2033032 RepID=UPI000BFC9F10|nr:fimbria/pilus outer membrane usher protein [Aeromonas sp. CA23]ATL98234.1 PapC/FimD family outer membrane usher protein [Aeromonas sp. CA23]
MKNKTVKTAFSILVYTFSVQCANANGVDFNTDLLDVNDKENIDFGQFSHAGYIIPGHYSMQVVINGERALGEREIHFKDAQDGSSESCLSESMLKELGLVESALDKVFTTDVDPQCRNLKALDGVMTKADIGTDTFNISIPQSYLEYSDDSWEPAARWDQGVNGVMLDYGLNIQHGIDTNSHANNTGMSAYGVAGANLEAWRLRADWQAQYQQDKSWHAYKEEPEDEHDVPNPDLRRKETHHQQAASITRIYAYRPLPAHEAKLTVGEIDLGNSVFDGFRFTGASLASDDNMLPPNLRGYAPEVVGIARTNAKVVISQGGRVLYETQVAAGPFRIQDLNSATSGELDVKVEELDGSVQTFQVKTASIPYLSRPGAIRYKFAGGKPSNIDHSLEGPLFLSGEASWGINNGWSLFGGGLLGDGYAAVTLGTGRDLLDFGAISFDMTESRADIPGRGIKRGGSYRVNYSKAFEKYDSQVAFAGYRFSERDFMNMSDYLTAKTMPWEYEGGSKEMYSVILSKQFRSENIGAYLDYTHQSYWYQPDSERFSLSLSHQFNVLDWRSLSLSLSAYRRTQWEQAENGMYLSLSVPFGAGQHVSYNAAAMNGVSSHSASYFNNADERNSYSLSASTSSQGGGSVSGFYSHTGDKAYMSANVSHQSNQTTTGGLSLQGGVTATADGAALHRVGMVGGSRVMVDADGASGVPVHSGGPVTTTDRHGMAVVADITSYYRQRTSIDVDQLGDDVEPIGSPVSSRTLTEGAIGYQHFDILSGSKRLLRFQLDSGKVLPFAAEVNNQKQQRLGMLGDDGVAYLAGLHAGDLITASWGENNHCQTALPSPLPSDEEIVTLRCSSTH